MRLFKIARMAMNPRMRDRRNLVYVDCLSLQLSQCRANKVFELGGRRTPSHRDKNTIRAIALFKVTEKVSPLETRYRSDRTGNRKPEGVLRPEVQVKQFVNQIVRGVFDFRDLLADDRTFTFDFFFSKL